MVLIRGILDFINNKVLLLFFSIVICILLMGCAKSQRMNGYGKEQDCDTNLREEVSEDANFSQQHYTIYNGNNDDDRWYFYYDLFDLEGNVREWSLEARATSHRIIRGGDFSTDISPSARSYSSPTSALNILGTRMIIYIK